MAPSTVYEPHVPRANYTVTSEEHILKLHSIIPGWEQLPSVDDVLQVHQVTGGITNRIYKLTNSQKTPCTVLVRIFGGQDVFTQEQRKQENEIFKQLGRIGIAPKLVALFENGRVEQFIDARPISLDDMVMPSVLTGVALAMARLHKFEPSSSLKLNRVPGVWVDIDKWVVEVSQLRKHNREFAEKLSVDLDECIESMQKLRQSLADSRTPSPVVFCHNDLLCGNIMLSLHDGKSVSIVDFEYSSFNYRGFDIGNFFCEAMGGTQDGYVGASRYPSESARRLFCRTYLQEAFGHEPDDSAIAALVEEAEEYGLLAHLYWGFWGLVQSVSSTVDFPYVLFAEQRFSRFFEKYSPKGTPRRGST